MSYFSRFDKKSSNIPNKVNFHTNSLSFFEANAAVQIKTNSIRGGQRDVDFKVVVS